VSARLMDTGVPYDATTVVLSCAAVSVLRNR
jgi:hypothetical protein